MANRIESIQVWDEEFSKDLAGYFAAMADKKKADEEAKASLARCLEFVGYDRNAPGTVRYTDKAFELTLTQTVKREVDVDALFEYAKKERIPLSELRNVFQFKLEVKQKNFYMLPEDRRREFEPFITSKFGEPKKEIVRRTE